MALDKSNVGVEEGYDMRVIISEGGHVNAELTAPYMERHMQHPDYAEFSKGLKVVFFDSTLRHTGTLTAKYGKYFESGGNIFLKDSVLYVNLLTGQRMYCHRMNYDATQKLFYSDTAVTYVNGPDTLYGTGFESNSDFSDYSLIRGNGQIREQLGAGLDSTGAPTDTTARDTIPR